MSTRTEDRNSPEVVAGPSLPRSAALPLQARGSMRHFLHRDLLAPADLVMPALVTASDTDSAYSILPTLTLRSVRREAEELWQVGVRAVKIFAMAQKRKDALGSESIDPRNLMMQAIKAFKDSMPEMCVITETCLCAYTESGSCTLARPDGSIDISGTCATLSEIAALQRDGGADVIGPAGMIDEGVRAIRQALDASGHSDVGVMPHLIFESSLYSLYRQTMKAEPLLGTRRMLQINPSRSDQALQKALRFVDEGAEMILLEPALPVIDVLATLRSLVRCPLGVFSVSGEYRLFAQGPGLATYDPVLAEFLISAKRCGADLIVTYAAKEIARWLGGGEGSTLNGPDE